MIPNKEKEGWHYLAVKNYLHCYIEQLQNISLIFIARIVFTDFEPKINLNLMKKYVKIKISVELQCYQKRIKYQNLINI